jgi:hypothetical protein
MRMGNLLVRISSTIIAMMFPYNRIIARLQKEGKKIKKQGRRGTF